MNSRKIKKNLRVLIQPTPNGKKWWVSGAFTTAEIPDLIDQFEADPKGGAGDE